MIYLFVGFAVFAMLLEFFAYRQGLKDGKRIAENKEVKPLFDYKPPKETVFDEKLSEEMEFVETFNG